MSDLLVAADLICCLFCGCGHQAQTLRSLTWLEPLLIVCLANTGRGGFQHRPGTNQNKDTHRHRRLPESLRHKRLQVTKRGGQTALQPPQSQNEYVNGLRVAAQTHLSVTFKPKINPPAVAAALASLLRRGGGGATTGFSIIHLFSAEGITAPSILICTEPEAVTAAPTQLADFHTQKPAEGFFFFCLARGFLDQIHPTSLHFLHGDAFKADVFTITYFYISIFRGCWRMRRFSLRTEAKRHEAFSEISFRHLKPFGIQKKCHIKSEFLYV